MVLTPEMFEDQVAWIGRRGNESANLRKFTRMGAKAGEGYYDCCIIIGESDGEPVRWAGDCGAM